MLLTSWLSSLRTKRFRRRVMKSAARRKQLASIRQVELLEERTLLTAFTIETLNLTASPGVAPESPPVSGLASVTCTK